MKDKSLFTTAKTARLNSHSPYSKFKVGAAVQMTDGKIYAGCNVENANYAGSICAERSAILNAISNGAKPPIKNICVVVDEKNLWPPCGDCRQVISEFSDKKTKITCANLQGKEKSYTIDQLLPEAFDKSFLIK